MGLILDTCVFIDIERNHKTIDFGQWKSYGNAFISAITVSELLMGVQMANTAARRLKRSAFVEAILAKIPAIDFTEEIARLHAEIYATLAKEGKMIGAHDLIIAATALTHDYPVLTQNKSEFSRVPGLTVLSY